MSDILEGVTEVEVDLGRFSINKQNMGIIGNYP